MKYLLACIFSIFIALAPHAVLAADDPLVVYSGRSDQFVRPVMERFTAETGIPVLLHAGSATELLNKLHLEGERTEADLYLSNDAGTLQIGADRNLFEPLPESLLEPVPANLHGGSWTGLSARARVLVVNTNRDTGWIRSIFDLTDPRLQGRIGITHASNESFVAGVSVYQALLGDARVQEWLEGLQRNTGAQVYPKHGAVVADVAAGRRDAGLVNHYYIFRHLAEHPDAPIELVVPDQGEAGFGVAWNVAGIAVSRHTGKREAALRLVEYLLSETGQRMFADANREYPVRRGVEADPDLPPVEDLRIADVPLSELAGRRDAALDLIDRVGMQ